MSTRAYLALAALVLLLVVFVLSAATGDVGYAISTGVASLVVLACLIRMDRTK